MLLSVLRTAARVSESQVMATATETVPQSAIPAGPYPHKEAHASGADGVNHSLLPWVGAQSINLTRHAAALRPFRRDEFGTGAAAPTPGHLETVNALISSLRRGLLNMSKGVTSAVDRAVEEPV